MLFREITEKYEEERFSPYAARSQHTKGRRLTEALCEVRTEFQRDRDRILHAKAFRRLKHKTQVFLSPEGDHYRTRLTHTLEVAQISRTIARALQLNEDLTEAIALGHDLGHTPFGHSGERILNEVHPMGFHHNEQSLRVVDHLEKGKRGYGLNLTFEVRDGILHHTGADRPATLEGQIVKISDRIAYINHDIDDAIRAGVLKYEDLPKDCLENLGATHSDRIHTMIMDLIHHSIHQPKLSQSREKLFYIDKLRAFMFENVYLNKKAKREEEKAQHIIQELYHYFLKNCDRLPEEMGQRIEEFGIQETVKDYIAGMTDRYAIQKYMDIFVPTVWK
ncbi:deoxyguanosinetriphosphate triphosphohydrolase [Geosporobacter ferrireducens]|uniref:Deoxyguanosinetriphosphate triphosphohydrolase-like protein n=1 Tax=Geosporobacter ferrireducens TaxID=1424294 RepID=A0A1D8GC71_9FIRM|nr:deoxyguanosinetriphosphate triphosphohydrolase [Geosporobacter ferrireducens]AOT68507.1 deoxyguanosinetriphosphate triphosphohydrolase [Geosporobacter ferrireducens]MTI53968.1 deoxyguanosinetriphosphate triphosphohydrolase [Geosporobacter ferrireducens]